MDSGAELQRKERFERHQTKVDNCIKILNKYIDDYPFGKAMAYYSAEIKHLTFIHRGGNTVLMLLWVKVK